MLTLTAMGEECLLSLLCAQPLVPMLPIALMVLCGGMNPFCPLQTMIGSLILDIDIDRPVEFTTKVDSG